ncbi:MAG: hypothetical protein ACLQJL_06540 [Roseiarcus sp.]
MAEEHILRIASKAIETSRLDYPDYPTASGAPRLPVQLEASEARLFAFAALKALEKAGFEIVARGRPNPPRP